MNFASVYRLGMLLLILISLGLNGMVLAKDEAMWEPVGLSGGGGMFTPAISPVDPDLMMVNCDMSAAYISNDGGRNWQMINQAQLRSDTRCRPGFHPSDPNVIYASSGGRLRISRDRGKTFSPIGDLRDSLYGEITLNPSNPDIILAGVRRGGAYLSRDGGKTWAACAGPIGQVIGFHFDRTASGRVIFAATDQGVWRSDDGGTAWKARTTSFPSNSIQGFDAGSNSKKDIVMLYCSIPSKEVNGHLQGGVYRSSDRGETWQRAMGTGINTGTRQLDQWSYGAVAQYRQILTTDAEPSTVYALNTSTGFHPPHHETVYRSDDCGETWRATYFQDPRFKEYNVAANYATASTGQSHKGGDTPYGAAICKSDPERLVLTWSRCYITHNGGASWFNGDTYPVADRKPEPGSPWVCNGLVVTTTWHYYIDPFESNRHYIAYTDIGMARSLDSGKTWIWWDKNSWAPWRNTCYEIAFDPDVPGKMWGAFSNVHDIPNDNIISERHGHTGPGGVCVSDDFGASWNHKAKGIPLKAVTSVVLDRKSPVNSRTLYAGVFMEGVYKSTDDGKRWTKKSKGLGHPMNMRVSRVSLHKDGTLFAMICAKRPALGKPLMPEGVGLYRSDDGAETWTKLNTPKEFLYPKDFTVHPKDSNTILLGVCDSSGRDNSGGLYQTKDGGKTWKRIGRQGRQTFGGYFHPKQKDWIYMTLTEGAPGAGLWLSRDQGLNWEPIRNLPFSNIQRITFDPSDHTQMWVTTFGGSVWKGPAAPQG